MVRVRAAVAAALFSLSGCLDAPPSHVDGDAGEWDGGGSDAGGLRGWAHRAPVTVDSLGQSVDDVPVLVRLSPEVLGDLDLAPDLRDLRFADGSKLLAHDLVAPAADGTANVYVRLELLPAGGITFDVYGGNPDASDGESASEVWQGFGGVWHLDQGAGGEYPDETGPHPAVLAGTAGEVNGLVGGAVRFDGSQSLAVADHPGISPPSTLTAEIAIRPDQIDVSDRIGLTNGTFTLQLCTGDDGTASFFVWDTGGGGSGVGGALADELEWVYLAGTFDGTNVAIYQNGTEELSVPISLELADTNESLSIGRAIDGNLDEARISPVARSGAWILAQQRMFADDGLVTVGSVVDVPQLRETP